MDLAACVLAVWLAFIIISWQDGALDQNLPLHLSLHFVAHMSCHVWL